VPLDRDPRDVASILDQLQIVGTRAAGFPIIDRKRAKGFAFARE
jgi:hypothetical protein